MEEFCVANWSVIIPLLVSLGTPAVIYFYRERIKVHFLKELEDHKAKAIHEMQIFAQQMNRWHEKEFETIEHLWGLLCEAKRECEMLYDSDGDKRECVKVLQGFFVAYQDRSIFLSPRFNEAFRELVLLARSSYRIKDFVDSDLYDTNMDDGRVQQDALETVFEELPEKVNKLREDIQETLSLSDFK